jgi:hypothetical protein
MKKMEKTKIEVNVYYSDFSGEKIEEYDRHFNQCVKCGRHMAEKEIGNTEDDGSLCKDCTEKGYEFKYSVDGSVGIVDKTRKFVKAQWL